MALIHMKAFQYHTQFSLSLSLFFCFTFCVHLHAWFSAFYFFFFFTIYLAFPHFFVITHFLPYIGFLSYLSLPPFSCPKAELCPRTRRCAVFILKHCRNVDDPTVVYYEAICHNTKKICNIDALIPPFISQDQLLIHKPRFLFFCAKVKRNC